MNNILSLSAEEILSVPINRPEIIFSFNNFKKEKMKIRSKWAPDRNKHVKATKVFQHLQLLFKEAEIRIENKTWDGKAGVNFASESGKRYSLSYIKVHNFELGKMYIGKTTVAYVIKEKYKELFQNGIQRIKQIDYIDNKIKNDLSRFMPEILFNGKTDIGYVLVINKPVGAILLQDLLDYMPDGKIPPKHVAWIINCLYNISVFFSFQRLCHNSITTKALFIDPENHSMFIFGGWWYAAKEGATIKSIPTELIGILPRKIFEEKKARTKYDRQAIKAIAINCLGDKTLVGSKLLADDAVPSRVKNWLRMPSTSSALDEYQGWEDILYKSFGKRKFIQFNVTFNDVYKEVL